MTDGLRLAGLTGTNPLAYFAALGTVEMLTAADVDVALSWTVEPIPRAVLHTDLELDAVIEIIIEDVEFWRGSPVFDDERDDIKLEPQEARRFIRSCSDVRSARLGGALVAEGTAADANGNCKPTDLSFTAGQQRFLGTAREIRDGVNADDVRRSSETSWTYESKLKSLMWDVADDRIYALSASDPSTSAKLTEPGAEWPATIGLSQFPVFADAKRTQTTGCGGSWKFGSFTWALWSEPTGVDGCRTVAAHARTLAEDSIWAQQLSIHTVLQSEIRRSEQGGYGTFGPPRRL